MREPTQNELEPTRPADSRPDDALVRAVADALEAKDAERVRSLVADLKAPDLAAVIEWLDPQDRVELIQSLGASFDFEALSELDPEVRDQLSEALPNELLAKAVTELESQVASHVEGRPSEASVYPYPIAFNALPHIDVFLDNGYTKEEWKVVTESRKILHLPELPISCTAVRIPVFTGHSEAVHVELSSPMSPEEARELFASVPGVVVRDDPAHAEYPMAIEAAGTDEVYVGRIRQDLSLPDRRGLAFWVVADNLRKGAATNAVQIAEVLARNDWLAPASRRAVGVA